VIVEVQAAGKKAAKLTAKAADARCQVRDMHDITWAVAYAESDRLENQQKDLPQ
jgi:hypothetical protein